MGLWALLKRTGEDNDTAEFESVCCGRRSYVRRIQVNLTKKNKVKGISYPMARVPRGMLELKFTNAGIQYGNHKRFAG